MIKLVIWDMDGLMVNSQPLQHKAHNAVLKKFGIELDHEAWKQWVQEHTSLKKWAKKNNIDTNLRELYDERSIVYTKLMQRDLRMMPGALRLIDALYPHVKMCVASGSQLNFIYTVLNIFAIKHKFDLVASDNQVPKKKPAPDVFQYCADQIGVSYEQCLVLEDSLAGLKAAKTAGMNCLVCPDPYTCPDISQYKDADILVESLEQVDLDTIKDL